MLPSSKLGQAHINHNGATLTVEAKFSKLLALQQESGVDGLARVAALSKSGPMGMVEVLHRFQVPHAKKEEQTTPNGEKILVPVLDKLGRPEYGEYSMDEIFDWLFGNIQSVNDETIMGQVGKAIGIVMGVEIKDEDVKPSKTNTKKK